MKVYVLDDDVPASNGYWIPATELLSAMGVEVCATTVSELSAELASLQESYDAGSNMNNRLSAENAELRDRAIGIEDALKIANEQLTNAIQRYNGANAYAASLRRQLDELQAQAAGKDVVNQNHSKHITSLLHQLGEAQKQVDELTRTVANRDGLIAQQTDTIQRIIAERDDAVTTLRNVQRLLNGGGLLP